MTLKEGGSVVFNIGNARVVNGNFVPFVVWFNFLSGFIYLLASWGLYKRKEWTKKLGISMIILILCVFIFFVIHIASGGLYEKRTVYAMIFRTLTWMFITLTAFKITQDKI